MIMNSKQPYCTAVRVMAPHAVCELGPTQMRPPRTFGCRRSDKTHCHAILHCSVALYGHRACLCTLRQHSDWASMSHDRGFGIGTFCVLRQHAHQAGMSHDHGCGIGKEPKTPPALGLHELRRCP
jgi:hypothetical protein